MYDDNNNFGGGGMEGVVVSDDTIMIGMEGLYFSLRALNDRTDSTVLSTHGSFEQIST